MTPGLGDIGIVPVRGPAGEGIEWAERMAGAGRNARWQHAFGVSRIDRDGTVWVVQAEPGGAREVALSTYSGVGILWLRCPAEYRRAVAAHLVELIGTGYSAAEYVAVGLHRLHIPAPGLRSYIGRSNRLICGQLCDLAAQRGGWTIFGDGRWPGYVIPSDLAAVAERQGDAV